MKKVLLFSVAILTALFSFSQDKIRYDDPRELSEWIDDYYRNYDYSDDSFDKVEFNKGVVEIFQRISVNDTAYLKWHPLLTYFMIEAEMYEECAALNESFVDSKDVESGFQYAINQISALIKNEDYSSALTLTEGMLEKYPLSYQLHYKKGVCLNGLDMLEESAEALQTSIKFHPTYSKSHWELAKVCYKQHHISQALLCMNLCLLSNPEGDEAFEALGYVNQMVSSKNTTKKIEGISISEDSEAFEEIDLLLNNYAAIDKKYKTGSKITLNYVKQSHFLMSQLDDFEGNGGFWDTYYVPLHQKIMEKEEFVNFSYTTCYSVKNPKFAKVVTKKEADVVSFLNNTFRPEWRDMMAEQELVVDGETKEVTFFFEPYFVGYGEYDYQRFQFEGDWVFYSKQGLKTAEGAFDKNGDKTGQWSWYYDNGQMASTVAFKLGKKEGEQTAYFYNGKLRSILNFKEGLLDGPAEEYVVSGLLREKSNYKEGEYHGENKTYHLVDGSPLSVEANYIDGKADGQVLFYDLVGLVTADFSMKDGKLHGVDKRYYNNGQLRSEEEYEEGKLTGDVISYHDNGQVFKKTQAVNGLFEGELVEYFRNGKVSTEATFSKGKRVGLEKNYNPNGVIYEEFEWKNNMIVAYRYYNEDGSIFKEEKKKKGEFYFEGYDYYGSKTVEGLYDVSGGKDGQWKYYEKDHMYLEEFYIDGERQGKRIEYYSNGQEKSVSSYLNDTLVGYYSSYFPSGQLYEQGWYHKGLAEGVWETYYVDGQLEDRNYYSGGVKTGVQESYAVTGELYSQLVYMMNGEIDYEEFYLPDGSAYERVNLDIDSNSYVINNLYPDQSIDRSYTFSNGRWHGPYKSYYYGGKIAAEGDYVEGKKHGTWIYHHKNGELSSKGEYFHNQKHGKWMYYNDNGTVSLEEEFEYGNQIGLEIDFNEAGVKVREIEYQDGMRHGKHSFYSEVEGKLQLIRHYKFGQLVGYSFNEGDGQLGEIVPVKDETAVINATFDNGKPSREMEIKNGDFTGYYREYYYNGQLCEESLYDQDERNGPYFEYFSDGTLKKSGAYVIGRAQGEFKTYNEKGVLISIVNYVNGAASGKAQYFDDKGNLEREVVFFNGGLISETILKS